MPMRRLLRSSVESLREPPRRRRLRERRARERPRSKMKLLTLALNKTEILILYMKEKFYVRRSLSDTVNAQSS